MTEAKLMPEFEEHDKVEACDLAAVGLFALGLSFAVRELTDGFIPEGWAETKTRKRAGGSAAQQLVDEGLWEPVEGGYRVHDFAVYNPTRADLDRRRRERDKKRSQRLKGTSRDVPGKGLGTSPLRGSNPLGDAVPPPSPAGQPGPKAPGDRVGGAIGGSGSSTSTSASSTSSPSSAARSAKRAREIFSAELEREWNSWLADYREITGSAVLGSKAARAAFAARRREGRSLEDLCLATRGNWANWGPVSDEPNLLYTRPETVLRLANVEGYILAGRGLRSGQVPRGRSSEQHPASRRIAERLGRGRIGMPS